MVPVHKVNMAPAPGATAAVPDPVQEEGDPWMGAGV